MKLRTKVKLAGIVLVGAFAIQLSQPEPVRVPPHVPTQAEIKAAKLAGDQHDACVLQTVVGLYMSWIDATNACIEHHNNAWTVSAYDHHERMLKAYARARQ